MGRRLAVLLLAGLLASVVVAMVGSAAGAAPNVRVVTRTFSSPTAIVLPTLASGTATPYPSDMNVGGFRRGAIRDVNLTLRNYSHGFPDDVAVLLEGPRGHDAIVMSDVGGGASSPVTNINLVLDDEAASLLPDSAQITGGRFRPTQGTAPVGAVEGDPRPPALPAPARVPPYSQLLSVFDGTNPNGTWSLFVLDDTSLDGGQLAGGWSVTIRARVLVRR